MVRFARWIPPGHVALDSRPKAQVPVADEAAEGRARVRRDCSFDMLDGPVAAGEDELLGAGRYLRECIGCSMVFVDFGWWVSLFRMTLSLEERSLLRHSSVYFKVEVRFGLHRLPSQQ